MEIQNNVFYDVKDLLNVNDMCVVAVGTNGPNKKANILHNKLSKYFFVSNNAIYILDRNTVTYRKVREVGPTLTVMISKLLEQSYDNFQPNEVNLINAIDIKNTFYKSYSITQYLDHLIIYLTRKTNVDVYYDQIHFVNGYYDLREGVFVQRVIGTHFITKYVDYPFDEKLATEKMCKRVVDDFSKIYSLKADFDAVMYKLGKAITGRSTDDQGVFTLFGHGSAGKTFVFKALKASLPCYVKTLKEDALSYNATNIDKVINTFLEEPQIRLAILNDPKDTKLNDSALKNFADGEIDTIKLYSEGSHTVKLMCLLVMIMNTIAQTKIDSGIVRRLKNGCYEHKSTFVDNDEDVNEKELHYKKDKQLEHEIKNNNSYKIAFLVMLFKYAKLTYVEEFKTTENFENSYNAIVNANNFIGDFINVSLSLTKKDDDRIHKDRMHAIFKQMYPDKNLTPVQLMSALKDGGIRYEPKFRCEGYQGCYVGVQQKSKNSIVIDSNDLDYGVKDVDMSLKIDYKKLYEDAQNEIANLRKQFEEKKPSIVKPKKNKSKILGDDKLIKSIDEDVTPLENYRDGIRNLLDLN
jgi:hypothetical protein